MWDFLVFVLCARGYSHMLGFLFAVITFHVMSNVSVLGWYATFFFLFFHVFTLTKFPLVKYKHFTKCVAAVAWKYGHGSCTVSAAAPVADVLTCWRYFFSPSPLPHVPPHSTSDLMVRLHRGLPVTPCRPSKSHAHRQSAPCARQCHTHGPSVPLSCSVLHSVFLIHLYLSNP